MEEEEDTAFLLAELRKVSDRSAANRFDAADDEEAAKEDVLVGVGGPPLSPVVAQPTSRGQEMEVGAPPPDQDVLLSPWKRYLKTVPSIGSVSSRASGEEAKDEEATEAVRGVLNSGSAAPPPPELPDLSSPTVEVPADLNALGAMGCAPSSAPDANDGPRQHHQQGAPAQDVVEPLALLRGVSSESASAHRFDDEVPSDFNQGSSAGVSLSVSTAPPLPPLPTTSAAEGEVATKPTAPLREKPWKRPRKPPTTASTEDVSPNAEEDVVVVVAAPRKSSSSSKTEPEPRTTNAAPTTSADPSPLADDQPPGSTLRGERGGEAHDPELLALLRDTSAKSAAASRFQDDAGEHYERAGTEALESHEDEVPAPPSPDASPRDEDVNRPIVLTNPVSLPPWKRPRNPDAAKKSPEVEVIVAGGAEEEVQETKQSPAPQVPAVAPSFKSDNPSAYAGERGGDAHDEELLALLRGVSDKSASASRFDGGGGDDDDNGNNIAPNPPAAQARSSASSARGNVPAKKPVVVTPRPWRRNRGPSIKKQQVVEVEVLDSRSGVADLRSMAGDNKVTSSTTVPNDPDEQAGAAEPQAGLRGVSSTQDKSTAAGEADALTTGAAGSNDPRGYGIGSGSPATLQGERGESKMDSEDVRVVSSNCFEEADPLVGSSTYPPAAIDKEGPERSDRESARGVRVEQSTEEGSPPSVSAVEPPERSNDMESQAPVGAQQIDATAEALPAMDRRGFKSNFPQTFSGDRGGAAEDPELLALLRGVSSNSSDRFAESTVAPTKTTKQKVASVPETVVQSPTPALRQEESSATATSQPTSGAGDLAIAEITRESLPTSIRDKNWKVRVAAIEYMTKELLALVSGQTRAWDVDSNLLLPGLDEVLLTVLEDSNASVLDKALDFTLLYAEHCQSAGQAEQASKIVSSLVQKNGFSSRPSTAKNACIVVLKLMEVGSKGQSSIHAITNVLLNEGLASKKPKVVQASISLVQDSAFEFGASNLPLASVIAAAPKLLSHSNQSVRKTALQILAEICRSLGSKSHLQVVIDKMKKAQVDELDNLLKEKPEPTPPKRELRIRSSSNAAVMSSTDGDAAKELAAQLFAARPSINLMQRLQSTEFLTQVALSKWSEKVKALNIVLECAGEKPYKLVPQSSSTNYAPLISELKKLLGHTHFAVCVKSMDVLTALAEGVGETLFPHVRPLLTTLLRLAKDKKLTSNVNSCLDSFFGRILGFDHLLDSDDSVTQVLDERKEKNTLARTTALAFLVRCIIRNESSGPRGSLSKKAAAGLAGIFLEKLGDSSGEVRKAAIDGLKALRDTESTDVQAVAGDVIESLKEKNSHAYKAIVGDSSKEGVQLAHKNPSTTSVANAIPSGGVKPGPIPLASSASPPQQVSSTSQVNSESTRSSADGQIMSLDRALTLASSLMIPLWDAPEDDAGVLAGLRSSKVVLRQDAIKSITAYIESGGLNSSERLEAATSSILTIVGEYTRGFKETNVNVMKSIVRLFVSVCETHEALETPVNEWIATRGVDSAVSKLSDKKLSDGCKQLLSCLCTVYRPSFVLLKGFESLSGMKSPLVHEEFLKWINDFCLKFSCASVGVGVNDVLPFLIQECESPNVKVKREAMLVTGTFYSQLGPSFRAIALNRAKSALREELEKCFETRTFDSTIQAFDWPKRSLLDPRNASAGQGAVAGVVLEVPRADIMAALGEDCIKRLTEKEGKTSWKVRKDALDEVEAALKRTTGLLNVSGPHLKNVIELTRALRDRLSDTQINLKPVAARAIAGLLSVVDKTSQAKLGRIVYAPLINAAMNDIKKPMRDAALEAIRSGTIASELAGGGFNDEALEPLLAALVSEVTEASARAGGLPDVLQFVLGMVEFFPNLEDNAALRGQSLGEKFAGLIVECLTSSKAETRTLALELLDSSIERNVLNIGSVQKVAGRMKPAKNRTVGPLIAKCASRHIAAPLQGGKENAAPATSLSISSGVVHRRDAFERNEDPSIPAEPTFRAVQVHETLKNPLFLRGGTQAKHPVPWLEYPEEPTGLAQYGGLRQSWSGMLPPASAAALFPTTGIKKQDDAQKGCELLVRAVEVDAASGSFCIGAHTEFILRWLALVLCTKEATVGLQAILSTVKVIFTHLMERQRPMTEAEAIIIVPFIIDRAGNSKGRFREQFIELVSFTENESLLSKRFLGGTCVLVVERSNHAKGRFFAYRLCAKHVETSGVVFLGKRGILSMAKALSEESAAENRTAVLDVMVAVLSRMNGDLPNLVRVCDQNLSEKARILIEERWLKRHQASGADGDGMLGKAHELVQAPAHPSYSFETSVDPCQSLPTRSASQSIGKDSRNVEADIENAAGSAAALRARLLRVREMSKPVAIRGAPVLITDEPPQKSGLTGTELYKAATDCFIELTRTRLPIDKNHPAMLAAMQSLKEFHSALCMNTCAGVSLSNSQLEQLLQQLALHRHDVIRHMNSLVRWSFRCGPPTVNAGISVDLANVCFATRMAMVRNAEIAALFTHEDLSLLIREACIALLDPRLTKESDLDQDALAQLGRAINRVVVQAATDAPRTAAFQSLLYLQDQLLREAQAQSYDGETSRISGLSRVVTRLFGRVVKSEEAKAEPYSTESVDMESLVCSIEDVLSAHDSDDAATDMARVLTESIVNTFGASALLSMLRDMGMGLDSSRFSVLVATCLDPGEDNAMLVPSPSHVSHQSDPSTPPDNAAQATSTPGTARDVASLVSALASAPPGPTREAALDSLREYTAINGDAELNDHLQQHVSSPFRAFIEQQVQGGAPSSSSFRADVEDRAVGAGTMSARLKALRSRLAVMEVGDAPLPPTSTTVPNEIPDDDSYTSGHQQSQYSPPRRMSRLAQPTPSKLVKPTQSKLTSSSLGAQPQAASSSSSSSSLTLRERLAASQENRRLQNRAQQAVLADGSASGSAQLSPSSSATGPSTAGMRAATLRARLEASKQMQKYREQQQQQNRQHEEDSY